MGKQKSTQTQPDKAVMTFEDYKLIKVVFELKEITEDFRHPVSTNIGVGYHYYEEEKILHVILGVKSEDKDASYGFEIDMVGVFKFENSIPEEAIKKFANINCPAILFPFVRETIADLTRRAGFTPLLLSPVNFARLFQEEAKTSQKKTSRKKTSLKK